MTYQISATRKDGRDADRRIDAVKINGLIWPIDQVIRLVLDHPGKVFSGLGLLGVRVYALRHPQTGRWFLTTSPDGYGPNNLLNLPDC